MQYYEVLVAHQTYHGSEALTYSAEVSLPPGAIVRISLRQRSTLGIVLRSVPRPKFEVKPIARPAPYPAIPLENIELIKWMYAYYPAPLGAVVRLFVPPTEVFPKPVSDTENVSVTDEAMLNSVASTTKPISPQLTADQTTALHTIQGIGTFLLHGITGSGKSRVYTELTAKAISNGKSAIILTPEIGLTAQLAQTFKQVFGKNVYVLHSQQTAATRRDMWYQLLASTEPVIVIGPRSALFSPVHNIGLIVLDESHDNAYKNESAPHYHAARVAAKLASLHGASLVLGSATPSVEDYYLAQERNRPIVAMNQLAKQGNVSDASKQTVIEMVDMRASESFSRSPLLSTKLLDAITASLSRGEQSLLFLNRRGTANVILCTVCGWQSVCPNCDLAVTYHGDEHILRCHVCGYHTNLPSSCPTCGNTEILFKSIGTKAVVSQIAKLFPSAKVQRFDTDAKKDERLEQHIDALQSGSADIIVGTQMVGKGLDLPKLSTVGILAADSSLLIPDYTAAEQTYQLISQVVGRVGRGHVDGTVIVQTYDPVNPTIMAAVQKDWDSFYESELSERKQYRFPPFTYLLKLRVLRATSKASQTAAEKLSQSIASRFSAVVIEGPAPSFHPRERGKYSWQLLIKSPSRTQLTRIITELPSGWSYDIDPNNLL